MGGAVSVGNGCSAQRLGVRQFGSVGAEKSIWFTN
jgi:hypothetical protein